MGLFSKKYCDICGEKIGLFGCRKLEDGMICSDCADQLSPWFDDRRHSTLEEIRAQLADREENKKAVAAFHADLELGENYRLLIDRTAGKFLVATETGVLTMGSSNPDIFSLSQVRDARMDISEVRNELYWEDGEGKRRAYDPRKFEYRYNFYIELQLDHPYVDNIRFRVNQDTVEVQWQEQSFSIFSSRATPTSDYGYRRYKNMCQEMIDNLLTAGEEREPTVLPRKEPEPAREEAEPEGDYPMMFCPFCGTRTRKAKFCTNCGANIE